LMGGKFGTIFARDGHEVVFSYAPSQQKLEMLTRWPAWLHLHHLEAIYSGKESMSLDLGSYYQRCITSAQKRYLAAIKTTLWTISSS